MATSANTIIAAAVARARREVMHFFEERGADTATKAVAYEAPDSMHRRQLRALVRRGSLRSTGDGRFWIDRQATLRERERTKVAVKILLILIFAAVSIAVPLILVLAR